MFQPNNLFEKRLLLLEDAFNELLSVAGLTGLLQQFRHGVETLKQEEADRVLGPILVTDDSATYPRAAVLLKERLTNVGLLYRDAIEGEEEPPLTPDNIALRVASLPSLDHAMGPNIANGLYHTQMQDGSVFPTMVIKKGTLVHVFVISVDGIFPTTLSLKHMPPDFDWNGEQKDMWRTELFRYRQDLAFTTLSERLDNALVDLDFSEVDQQYAALLQEAQRDADTLAERLTAEAQTTAAAVEADGEAAAQEITAANEDTLDVAAAEEHDTETDDTETSVAEDASESGWEPTADGDVADSTSGTAVDTQESKTQ